MSNTAAIESDQARAIVYRSRGQSHGYITRLMSPGDLGRVLKPFVFLDLFDNRGDVFPTFGLHPHSGLATLTYVAEGSVSYEDTNNATGILRAGGVEWMRAGKGVWHAGGAGEPGLTRGFQLWVALPPDLELGPSESVYQPAADIPQIGPARVLLGEHEGAKSSTAIAMSINYLAVTLKAGERWRYQPPQGHSVLWLAMGKGRVSIPEVLEHGEIIVFEPGETPVDFLALDDAEYVIGSAVPHPHDLVLGYYSVHTSAQALQIGEAQIQHIRRGLVEQGRL
ncbi:pirin family protein [Paraburkholderia madseniana]|uniref:Pirin family protein n=1 Tax=Paraburkholderia madseniana TaxID=2599607 RepID=A0A6N6W5F4_9BURK|nr:MULTISPECIES: pirin family protein [Paraburkholderia]KAE8755138.1 pirin family protein [Paraburkholderia madseniana]MCX4146244.1 pirin family protein [Paraburkholderia madseniana]MDN7149190.1 pirin family protein [Paraburkholderia sp. WS6]MDQ6408070.1 pirin family protein [Paraburkholderia madseniana]